MPRDEEELPGRVSKAEQDRRREENRRRNQQRQQLEQEQETRRGEPRRGRRGWQGWSQSDTPAPGAQRGRDPESDRSMGRNEAAVYEYLRRNPEARPADVAFHAIYGGGTTAWEGLHRKTRAQASAEASRVISRLQAQGKIRITGYTLGGKPKYVTDTHQEPKKAEEKRDALGRKIKSKKGGGGDAPAEDKGSLGVWSAPGSKGGDDSGGSSGGGAGGLLGGGMEGLIGGGGSSSDDSGDDDGPRDGRLW